LKDYVRKHYATLKDLFINLASQSIFPNISANDFNTFVHKCSILDDKLKLDRIDRLFIATNYEMED